MLVYKGFLNSLSTQRDLSLIPAREKINCQYNILAVKWCIRKVASFRLPLIETSFTLSRVKIAIFLVIYFKASERWVASISVGQNHIYLYAICRLTCMTLGLYFLLSANYYGVKTHRTHASNSITLSATFLFFFVFLVEEN